MLKLQKKVTAMKKTTCYSMNKIKYLSELGGVFNFLHGKYG